jgi:hypothetical protein
MSSFPSRGFCSTVLLSLGVALGTLGNPGMAVAANEIVTDVPPPADRVEHAPPTRDGYAWAPGHWEWNSRSYVWVSGTWIMERRAAHWVADRWEAEGAKWRYIPGHWER